MLLETNYVVKGAKRFSFSSDAFFTFPLFCSSFYEIWAPAAALVGLAFLDVRYALCLVIIVLVYRTRFDLEIKNTAILRIKTLSEPDEMQILADIHLLRQPGGVDEAWYLSSYSDSLEGDLDAVEHYCRVGWRLGRHPNPSFSTTEYLRRNADVAVFGMNPLVHFLIHGKVEGRIALPLLPRRTR